MNETIKNILSRVSVRSYKPEQVKDEDLELIIKCGLNACTAMNYQPWHMTVIQNKDAIEKIVDANRKAVMEGNVEEIKERFRNGYHNFYHAPTVIIVSGKEGVYTDMDCGNMLQNMTVAAESLGLSTCYIASFKNALSSKYGQEILDVLQLPVGYTPRASIALGYMAGEKPEAKERKYEVTFIR